MARINPVKGETIVIQVGDGNTPVEAFTVQALINESTTLDMDADVETEELVDLADLSVPGLKTTTVTSVSLVLNGEGTVHKANQKYWMDWMKSGAAKNCIITQLSPPEDGGWKIDASLLLTKFSMQANRRKNTTGQVTLMADGDWTVSMSDD